MNQELTNNPFNPVAPIKTFDEIKVSLASPERILSWSFGEIKKPETINYRTFKPERDGLFCARIFGPIKDYECLCGKYKRMKYRGVVCEKCGVEVTLQKVRRERMGHIELASPVAHIWFLKSLPSRIGLMLDMTLRDLERILYFENYVVIEPGLTDLTYGQLMNEEEFLDAQDIYGMDAFTANIGAEAIREMLSLIDLEAEAEQLRVDLSEATGELKPKKIIKRLKIVESFIESGNRPEWMILTVIPVIPPELRPLVPLDGGRFATSDLNDLYRRVINRNNRLKRLIELRAPDIIVRNEKRMLQESVDALFDNGRRGRVITGQNKRPLKSLSDMLKGKQGRFRQNLLGKRVDFSGRSVIVTGPELKLHQCGLPKKMALELFKPFIYSRLEAKGLSSTVKQAKKLVEKERPEVWDILDEVIREHPVMLNRAPTLHRLGIQAFEPVLIEGKAIQLHPLVCSAFNADFDGDQMAVHVPLSLEAQLEARVLMMSTNNVLSPANGAPIIVPSQDMILGLYYTSLMREGMKGEGMIFGSVDEVQHALDAGVVHLHAKIQSRIPQIDDEGNEVMVRFETTPGRVRLGALLPQNAKAPFSLVNRLLKKGEVQQVIDTVYRYCGQKESVIFCDHVMTLGFREAFRAGISFGKDDMLIPDNKWTIVDGVRAQVKEFEQQYMDGLITQGEKYNKVIDAWSNCNDQVTDSMMDAIASVKYDEDGSEMEPNSVYMMAHSKARGSVTQMKQLGGMRGLMAKPNGDIIETPIISNFKEGLTVLEYFNSTHGARKGLSDTALKTANSGYLTRRLVDVSQDVVVTSEDCGTLRGLTASALKKNEEIVESLYDRILGRTSLNDVYHPETNELLIEEGKEISEEVAIAIEEAGIEEVEVRSVLTCETVRGICAKCYGRSLSTGKSVQRGEAVGVIAAQSIGEPGTQLTLRTFHVGGTASNIAAESKIESKYSGRIEIDELKTVEKTNDQGEKINVVIGRSAEMRLINTETNAIIATNNIPYGSELYVKSGDTLKKGDLICKWDPYNAVILAEFGGKISFENIEKGVTYKEESDEQTGFKEKVIIENRDKKKNPTINIVDKTGEVINFYNIPVGAHVIVDEGDKINTGTILVKIPRSLGKTGDITGGLPRVTELFEARNPSNPAVVSEIDGIVSFGKIKRGNREIIVESRTGEIKKYLVSLSKHILVQENDFTKAGLPLSDGAITPRDILNIKGPTAVQEYIVNEIQEVYRLQGVKINDKHFEVIVRQMMRKVEINDSGDTKFLEKQLVNKSEFIDENDSIFGKKVVTEKGDSDAFREGQIVSRRQLRDENSILERKGLKMVEFRDAIPATGRTMLQGITKASLQTDSFISAASFQETTKVLNEAAVSGKVDHLLGLKENVIVGHKIPAGTGLRDYEDIIVGSKEEYESLMARTDETVGDIEFGE